MTTPSEVLNAAMSLDSKQRAEIACQILLSLEPAGEITPADENAEKAWVDEIRRRRDAIRQGQATPRDWDTALDAVRQSILSKKPA